MANILIVNHSRVALHMIRRVLQLQGHTIFTAEDSIHGLDRLSKTNMDLIISDTNLPSCDGFEFFSHIRAKDKQLPFVMLTETGDDADAVRAERMAVDGFITQPFESADLINTITPLMTHR